MFVPSFGVFLQAVLLVLGLLWCKEILGRLRSDIARLRESEETAEKGVIIFLWVVTAVILLLIVRFVLGLASGILSAF